MFLKTARLRLVGTRTEGGQVVDPSSGSSVTAAWAVMGCSLLHPAPGASSAREGLHINDERNLCQNTFTKALTGAVSRLLTKGPTQNAMCCSVQMALAARMLRSMA